MRILHPTHYLASAATALLFSAASTQAATLFSNDFDAANGMVNYEYNYGYFGYDSPNGGPPNGSPTVTTSQAFPPGIGVGGSTAFQVTANAAAAGASIPMDAFYSFYGIGAGENGDLILGSLTSALLSDYSLAISSAAGGLTGVSSVARIDLTLYKNAGVDQVVTLRFNNLIPLSAVFQTANLNLGSFTSVEGGSLAGFAADYALIDGFNWVVQAENGPSDFGYDDGNTLVFDNFSLNQAPEPTVALQLLLGAVAMAGVRRRR